MTVGELIEKLKGMDSERVVILSSDSEGNGYAVLDYVTDDYVYELGDIAYPVGTPDVDPDDTLEGTPAVVLFP